MSETRMPKEHFTIKYDGESLRQHEMDVAVLAPALMAMSEIVKHIQRLSAMGSTPPHSMSKATSNQALLR